MRFGTGALLCALVTFAPAAEAVQPNAQPSATPSDRDDAIAPAGLVPIAPAPVDPLPIPADKPPWRPLRRYHVGPGDAAVTAGAAAVVIAAAIVPPQSTHQRGGVVIDDDARDVLRVGTQWGRYAVRDASDVGVSLAATWPFLIDALFTAWYHRGDPKLARDMALVTAETFAIAGAAQGITNGLVSRERPYGSLCGIVQPEDSVDCRGNVRYRSFFSGHAMLSFASASVLCVNHLGLGLLGNPWDKVTCAMGYGVAAMTGIFRVMSDMHYVSDITIGASVGTFVGLLVPYLHLEAIPRTERNTGVDVRVAPVGQGVGVQGTF